MTNKKAKLERALKILRALYYLIKFFAILFAIVATFLMFLGLAGDIEGDFSSFLSTKMILIAIGLVLVISALVLVKFYQHIDNSIRFLELELEKVKGADKKARQERFLEDLWNHSLPYLN